MCCPWRHVPSFLVVIVVVIASVCVQRLPLSLKNVTLLACLSNGVDLTDVQCNVKTTKSTWRVVRSVQKHAQAKNTSVVNYLAVSKAASVPMVFSWMRRVLVCRSQLAPVPMMINIIQVDQRLFAGVTFVHVPTVHSSAPNWARKSADKNALRPMNSNARTAKNAYRKHGDVIKLWIAPIKLMNRTVSINVLIKLALLVLMDNASIRTNCATGYQLVAMVPMKSTAVSISSIILFICIIDVFLAYVQPCKDYTCKTSKKCIPRSWVCDGSIDCGIGDDSDEAADCSKLISSTIISLQRTFFPQNVSDAIWRAAVTSNVLTATSAYPSAVNATLTKIALTVQMSAVVFACVPTSSPANRLVNVWIPHESAMVFLTVLTRPMSWTVHVLPMNIPASAEDVSIEHNSVMVWPTVRRVTMRHTLTALVCQVSSLHSSHHRLYL